MAPKKKLFSFKTTPKRGPGRPPGKIRQPRPKQSAELNVLKTKGDVRYVPPPKIPAPIQKPEKIEPKTVMKRSNDETKEVVLPTAAELLTTTAHLLAAGVIGQLPPQSCLENGLVWFQAAEKVLAEAKDKPAEEPKAEEVVEHAS